MTPCYRVFLCAVVIVLMLTAGCTFSPTTTGPGALITETQAAGAQPLPSAPAATGAGQPGAAGTQGASGTCTADISSDPANCGGCGYACPANAVCQQGQCYCAEGYAAENNQCVPAVAPPSGTGTGTGCPEGMSPCPDGYCYELTSSSENCGICGNTCPAGMICSASTCTPLPSDTTAPAPTTTSATVTATVTSTGTLGPWVTGGISHSAFCILSGGTMCDGTCVNLTTSTTNCGECGKVCKSLAPTCCKGVCVDTKTSTSNCGTCGHKCPSGTSCISGSCKSSVVITGIPEIPKVPTYSKIVKPVQIPIGPVGP